MRRYLAILWHDACEPAIIAAALALTRDEAFHVASHQAGLMLLASGIPAWHFEPVPSAAQGVVLGEPHYLDGRHDAFDGTPVDMQRIAEICRAESLAEHCWGSFLTIQPHCDSRPSRIDHSALSTLPAYYAVAAGVLLLASDADLIKRLIGPKCAIDWRSIAMQLQLDDIAFKSTGLHGICELRGGETLEWRPGASPTTRHAWDPWFFTERSQSFSSQELALENLERELARCISACTLGLGATELDLSGGLDSSILAALCSRNGTNVRAVNIFSEATDGDERGFARAVAACLGLLLAEHAVEASEIDVSACASPELPRPHARSFVQEIDRLTTVAAPEAQAFINGGGGDAVFCHLQSSGPAVDALYASGPLLFFRTLEQVASAAQVSFWTALSKAAIKAVRRPSNVRLVEDASFLTVDARVSPRIEDLPWPPPPRGMPPGKLEQVRGIYSSVFNTRGFARSSRLRPVFPMLSQPLVETCLRIPSWMWLGRRYDRYLAREVASKWLPSQVAWRRSKGGLGQLQRDIYHRNRAMIRDLLLDGDLRKAGVIDHDAVAIELRPERDFVSDQYARLLRLCDVEVWARHWA